MRSIADPLSADQGPAAPPSIGRRGRQGWPAEEGAEEEGKDDSEGRVSQLGPAQPAAATPDCTGWCRSRRIAERTVDII